MQVRVTPRGYFTAALAAVNATTSNALAQDTLQYATCLWTRDVCNVSARVFATLRLRAAELALSLLHACLVSQCAAQS